MPTGSGLPILATPIVLAMDPCLASAARGDLEPTVRFLPVLWPCGPPMRSSLVPPLNG